MAPTKQLATETKWCSGCQENHPLDQFAMRGHGLSSSCKNWHRSYNKVYYHDPARREMLRERSRRHINENRAQRLELFEKFDRPAACAECGTRLRDRITTPSGQTKPGFGAVTAYGLTIHAMVNGLGSFEDFEEALNSPETRWVCFECNHSSTKSTGPQRSLRSLVLEACRQESDIEAVFALITQKRRASKASVYSLMSRMATSGLLIRKGRGRYVVAPTKSRKKSPFGI